MAVNPDLRASDHKEAVRLAWMCRHIPVGTLLLGSLLLTGSFSAVSMVWAYGQY